MYSLDVLNRLTQIGKLFCEHVSTIYIIFRFDKKKEVLYVFSEYKLKHFAVCIHELVLFNLYRITEQQGWNKNEI